MNQHFIDLFRPLNVLGMEDQFLPPAGEVCEGYVFTSVCHSVHRGWRAWQGACMVGGSVCRRDGYLSERYASHWNAFLSLVRTLPPNTTKFNPVLKSCG